MGSLIRAQDLVPFKDATTDLFGYKNSGGLTVIKPKYYTASRFTDGMAAVWNGKGGYINATGQEIIPLKFDMTFPFKNGTATVMQKGHIFSINKKGERINSTTIASTQPNKVQQNDYGFSVLYKLDRNPATRDGTREIINRLRQNGQLQSMIRSLNATFRLPRPITIYFTNLWAINAQYRPDSPRIEFGLEMVDYIQKSFAKKYKGEALINKSTNAIIFMLFHEVGHALKDLYKLKLPGNEETIVDEFATFLLTANQEAAIEEAAFNGAEVFAFMANDMGPAPYWDEHPQSEQRFYDVLCKLYGKNPSKYLNTVKAVEMGKGRLDRCAYEYHQMMENWMSILAPHFRK